MAAITASILKDRATRNDDRSCLTWSGICCGTCLAAVLLVTLSITTGLVAVAGSLSFLQPSRPTLTGSFDVGTLRGRLPAGGDRACGLFAQVSYPMDATKDVFEGQSFPFWRDEIVQRVAHFGGYPEWFGTAILGGQPQLDPPGAPLNNSEGGWPVIVFSAGLSGFVEVCQQFTRDLASNGAIVVALEHEDRSGIYATDCDGNVIEQLTAPKPEMTIADTVEFRRPFLERRLAEHGATMEALLKAISADGTPPSPIEQVLQTGRSDRITLAAHSFGGASAWHYSQHLKSMSAPSPFVGVIYLDLWAAPLTEEEQLAESPDLLVHLTSDEWEAQDSIRANMEAHPGKALAAAELLGNLHQWIADTQYILPYGIARKLGLIGEADVPTSFFATLAAMQETLKAFYDPERRTDLSATIQDISPELMVAF